MGILFRWGLLTTICLSSLSYAQESDLSGCQILSEKEKMYYLAPLARESLEEVKILETSIKEMEKNELRKISLSTVIEGKVSETMYTPHFYFALLKSYNEWENPQNYHMSFLTKTAQEVEFLHQWGLQREKLFKASNWEKLGITLGNPLDSSSSNQYLYFVLKKRLEYERLKFRTLWGLLKGLNQHCLQEMKTISDQGRSYVNLQGILTYPMEIEGSSQ